MELRESIIPDWYTEAEIYKKKLSLSEWGDELQWRYELRECIRREKLDKYGDIHKKENFKRSFLYSLNGGVSEQIRCLGKDIGEPARILGVSGSYDCTHYINNASSTEGIIIPVLINLSYNRKIVTEYVNDIINELYDKIPERLAKDSPSAAKGNVAFKKTDTEYWQERKFLQWIDLDTWGMIGINGKYDRDDLVLIIWGDDPDTEETEKTLSDKTIRKARNLLDEEVISRIKASAKLHGVLSG